MALGRNTIHKLGKRIREAYGDGSGSISENDLHMLQEYRLTYRDSIASVFKVLYEISKRIDAQSIVTYRIKRINSIVEKLKRFPTTALDQMIDIAGCRCISNNVESVYKIIEELRGNPQIVINDVKDYIKVPQPEGYRSVHLYVALKEGDKKSIEIQLRTREQHDWATLVEISDVIIPESKLKEYDEPKDLWEFHRILSIPEDEITDKERNVYFKVLRKYDYINRLQKIFLQNTFIRHQWLNTKISIIKNFFLIEAGVDNKTKISCYQTFKEAEEAYFERFIQDSNANLVLTQIQNVTFEQLTVAYSNYVLSTHTFTTDCINRFIKEMRLSMRKRDLDRYSKALDSYLNIIAHQIIHINQEIYTLNKSRTLKIDPKQREWLKDLQKQVAQLMSRKDRHKTLYRETEMYKANIITRMRFSICAKTIARKYENLVQQHVPS